MSIEVIRSPWRTRFKEFVISTERSLLLVAPFIKLKEAAWLTETVANQKRLDQIHLTILTSFQADSVLSNTLEIQALSHFQSGFPSCKVISVPHLHAKVYISDETRAIVTSANLTTAALDQNAEYGIQINTPSVVQQISLDLLGYAKLGSPVPPDAVKNLGYIASDLVNRYRDLQNSAASELRRTFNNKLYEVTQEFLATQVGPRTAHALFAEAILYVLRKGPLPTRELHSDIQQLLPELCDDSMELIINGQSFGKRWKHKVRTSQVYLRRKGAIALHGDRWALVQDSADRSPAGDR